MASKQVFTITGSSSASASTTTIVGNNQGSLLPFDWFTVDASLTGATGGTCDVYLQRKVDDNIWADWLHFPQLTAGQAATQYTAQGGSGTTIYVVEQGTDASAGTPALAANTFVGGHPGQFVRCVAVTGIGVSVAASITIKITGWKSDK